jgi:hypothetical protein
MAHLSNRVEDPLLLLFEQGPVGVQGNPSSTPRVQALDLSAAGLLSGPILGGKGVGEGRGEEEVRLPLVGGEE